MRPSGCQGGLPNSDHTQLCQCVFGQVRLIAFVLHGMKTLQVFGVFYTDRNCPYFITNTRSSLLCQVKLFCRSIFIADIS